ncbi:hypothetical protein DRN85_10745 [Methanosarcinales archaeon]|nr:MAG: hypothetical protein DRN85_10745 [Methanosarcinales archaeon]
MEKRKKFKRDFFYATLEGGELVMEPHCACGNYLLEEYYCEKCKKQCRCTEIRCRNKETFEYVNRFLKSNKSFHNFTAVLDEETEKGD